MKPIGKILRKTREKKGLSLEEAASQTRIHHGVLKNLEDDNFHLLPSPAYVKGFLKRYGEYLGLQSGPLIEEYLSTHPREPEQVLALKGKKIPRLRLDKFIVLGGLTAALIIILISGFFAIRGLLSRKSAHSIKGAEQAAASAKVKPVEANLPLPPPPVTSVKKVSGPLRLEVFAEKDGWLEVRCNGKLLFQGVLSQGDREVWQGEDKIRLRIGNAGAFKLNLNGNSLGKSGKEGEVLKEVILTKENIKVNR